MEPLAAAWNAFEREQYAKAEQLYRECLAMPGLTPEQQTQARFGLAYVLAFTGRFDAARSGFEGLQREAARRQDRRTEHQMLHQVGMVERLAGRWAQARACFETERQLIGALNNEPLAVSINAYELGTVAQHFGEARAARAWFELALNAARQTQDAVAVACAQRGLGDWAREFGTPAEARSFWEAALGTFRQASDERAGRELDQRLASLASGPR